VRKAKRLAAALRRAGIKADQVDIVIEEDDEPGVTTVRAALATLSVVVDFYDDSRAMKCKGVPLARVGLIDLGGMPDHEGLVPENEVAVNAKALIERELKLQRLGRQVLQLRKKLKAA
jgi:hypothetical protein